MFPLRSLLINDIEPRPVSFVFAMLALLPSVRPSVLVSKMTELVLKKIAKHFGDAPWLEKENDYLVLNDAGRIIGRIMIRARSPRGGLGSGQLPHANSRFRSLIIRAIQRPASRQ